MKYGLAVFAGVLYIVFAAANVDHKSTLAAKPDVISHNAVTPPSGTGKNIDPVFKPYLDMYLSEKGSSLSRKISIQFGPQQGVALATCWMSGKTAPAKILVSRDDWNDLDENAKIILMFHELGHCDLGYDHTSSDGYEIMSAIHVGNGVPNDHLPYLLQEFFHHKTHGAVVAKAENEHSNEDAPCPESEEPMNDPRSKVAGAKVQIFDNGDIYVNGVTISNGGSIININNHVCIVNGTRVPCN